MAAAFGLAFVQLFNRIDVGLRRFDGNPVMKAAWGGLAIGVVALVAGEHTIFSGEHAIGPVALGAALYTPLSAGVAVAVTAPKLEEEVPQEIEKVGVRVQTITAAQLTLAGGIATSEVVD